MPNDPEIGPLPDVSMGCSVVPDPNPICSIAEHHLPIFNLSPPDPQSDLGSVSEVSPGTWYSAGQPEFVGAMPLRTDLSILPSSQDFQPLINPSQFALPPDHSGQVLVASDSGAPQWGRVDTEPLAQFENGGLINLSQGSSLAEGDIRFHAAGGLEIMRISANGDFFVHGNKVDNDHEIYQHFRKFLGMSYSLPVPDPRPRDGIETRYERILKKSESGQ